MMAGASGMDWGTFVFYNATGAIVWATVISAVGYLFGNSLPLIEKWVGRTGLILFLTVLVGGLVFYKINKARQARAMAERRRHYNRKDITNL